ncbi:hypothetical protein DFS34DRAFT_595360 [Phlyctochytrium arcticum]|nr:hypothetical protein DFS34DRAFT_595360 [Phlyctochytrium arcticum]
MVPTTTSPESIAPPSLNETATFTGAGPAGIISKEHRHQPGEASHVSLLPGRPKTAVPVAAEASGGPMIASPTPSSTPSSTCLTTKTPSKQSVASLTTSNGESDDEDNMDESVPAPPTRRRGSVLDDTIMRDMLGKRAAPAEGQEDKEELERMERIWSKRYRSALVRDANAVFAAEVEAAQSPIDDDEPSLDSSSPPGHNKLDMTSRDMTTRRSSMSTGSFGAGRVFASSELDAALAAFGADGDEREHHERDQLVSRSGTEATASGSASRRESDTSVNSDNLSKVSGKVQRSCPASSVRNGTLSRGGGDGTKRTVRFSNDIIMIQLDSPFDDDDEYDQQEEEETDSDMDEAATVAEEPDAGDFNTHVSSPAVQKRRMSRLKTSSPNVKKLTKAFKKVFMGSHTAKPAVNVA